MFLKVTVALGTTASEESVTVPTREPDVEFCAIAAVAANNDTDRHQMARNRFKFIPSSISFRGAKTPESHDAIRAEDDPYGDEQ
jgi:hypothetical protein